MEPAREAPNALIAAFEQSAEGLGRVRAALRGVVFGQDAAVDLALASVVAGGHAVLTGPPGSAKTRLVRALGRALGLAAGEFTLTPDTEMSDLMGEAAGRRAEDAAGGLRARGPSGPLFRSLVLAEDLDRATPRLRSALLEAVHEGRVGAQDLPRPFHLFATRGAEAPQWLSETETDRFLMQIDMRLPARGDEKQMLIATAGRDPGEVAAVLDTPRVLEAQRVAVELPVGEKVVEAILDLVRRARPDDPSAPSYVRSTVAKGPGPRAGQALMRLARARALVDGRPSPSSADVRALAVPVLKPRLLMRDDGGRPFDAEAVVTELAETL